MFIAKFSQVDSDSEAFNANKNGEMPFIGTVLAGTYTGTIIDGTIFEREELIANKAYACQNYTEEYTNPDTNETTAQSRVQIIGEVSLLEYNALAKQCGKVKDMIVKSTSVAAPSDEAKAAAQTAAGVAFEA
jgi:hypothetical protein